MGRRGTSVMRSIVIATVRCEWDVDEERNSASPGRRTFLIYSGNRMSGMGAL